MRRKPFSVVLFDEIEKAHPDVFNTLLQILEEGRLTDSQGRSVDFRNTVLIMTSNLGTQDLRKANVGFTTGRHAMSYERMKEKVNDSLKNHFRPEFLNRIDETIVFHELSRDEVLQMVDLQLERSGRTARRAGSRHRGQTGCQGTARRVGLRPAARRPSTASGDPASHRRRLSEKILYKEFSAGEIIVVDVEDDPDDAGDKRVRVHRRRGLCPAGLGRVGTHLH